MLGIEAKINKSPLHSAPGNPHLSIYHEGERVL